MKFEQIALLILLAFPLAASQTINETVFNETISSMNATIATLRIQLLELNSTLYNITSNQTSKLLINEYITEELNRTLKSNISAINSSISSINSRLNELISSHNSLIIKVNSTSSQLSEMNETITKLKSDISTLNQTAENLKQKPSTSTYVWIAITIATLISIAALTMTITKS